MNCPEEQLVAFLSGELSTEEERAFDQHLLECEWCWRAVQADRIGHLAVERLREPAPPGLRDRISMAISLEEPLGAARRRQRTSSLRRRSAVALVIMGLFVVGAGATYVALPGGGGPSDPSQVSVVVAMVTPDAHPSAALLAGKQRVVNSQQMTVRAYMVHGKEALVATSMEPFPMPAASHLLAGSSPRAWMATDGPLNLYGVNRSSGQQSMFVVAAMPMAALPEVAAQLHLI